MALLYTGLYLGLAALTLLYLLVRKRFSYWADRGVPHVKPVLFYGNMREVGRSVPLRTPLRDVYARFKGRASFAGFYLAMRPAALLLDLELVKGVLIKDFANFAHRGHFYNEVDDPLSGHLFNLDGPKWRRLRAKLTPTFTSGKMRFMQPTVVEVAERFVRVLGEQLHAAGGDVEIKELLARYTTDVIGTCAFGLECNSLRDPHTQFRVMGRKAFTKRRHTGLAFSLIQAFPQVARRLGVRMVPDDVAAFFMGVVRDTVEYREREGVQRNDFMNLLLELRRQDRFEGLTLEEVAAQVFVFFLAGFETSSSTMGFALYELAVQPALQERARAEVAATLERHGGRLTYEALHELKYMQQVVHETLRKYSIASMVVRKTIADYPVPGSGGLVIERGTMVIVPVDAIHHDPEIYPQPEQFDPDRFGPEALERRHSMAWLPFGEGPRNCIGLRFGEMQAVIGLALLLRNFRFSTSDLTPIPLEIDPKQIVLNSKGGIVLNVERV